MKVNKFIASSLKAEYGIWNKTKAELQTHEKDFLL